MDHHHRRRKISKPRVQALEGDLYFALPPGNVAFSWNFKDHLALFRLSPEVRFAGEPHTKQLRSRKDLKALAEAYRKNQILDNELLDLFTHELDGALHEIRGDPVAGEEMDYLSFALELRNRRHRKGPVDLESQSVASDRDFKEIELGTGRLKSSFPSNKSRKIQAVAKIGFNVSHRRVGMGI